MKPEEILKADNRKVREEFLKAFREAIDMDGRDHVHIGKAAGTYRCHINSIYNDVKMPLVTNFIKICAALGKSPNEVLNWEE